jgi:8-oxo-dGTP diphosphatase
MMRRYDSARFLPGLWAPIGGHIEANEFRMPQAACEREILEETGLAVQDIDNLSLRYIVLRIHQSEIRIQFSYFGSTTKRELAATDEGELHWVPLVDVPNLTVSATTRFMIEHYAKIGLHTNSVYIGSVSAQDGNPFMNWSLLSDWE